MVTKKLVRNLLAAVIVALGVALAVVMLRSQSDLSQVHEDSLPASKGDVALRQVRYTETSGGVKQWILIADGVEYWRDKEVSRLENIEMTFYSQDEAAETHLKSRHGRYDLDHRELELWGDVVLTTSDGLTFRTDRAFYEQSKREVSSKGRVQLSSAGSIIHAVGMRYRLDSSLLELLSDVEAEIRSEGLTEKN